MLHECPNCVGKRAGHRNLLVRKLRCSKRRIAVHLADHFLQIAKRKLPDRGVQLSEAPCRQELVAFVHGVIAVAYSTFAEELRLSKVRIPSPSLLSSVPSCSFAAARDRRHGPARTTGSTNLVASFRRAALVGIEAENPIVAVGRDGVIAKIANTVERKLYNARAEPGAISTVLSALPESTTTTSSAHNTLSPRGRPSRLRCKQG